MSRDQKLEMVVADCAQSSKGKRKLAISNVKQKKVRFNEHELALQVTHKDVKEEDLTDECVEVTGHYGLLLTRSSLRYLTKCVADLSTEQCKVVKDMGFESILKLKIDELPQKLCYWLMENFEPIKCCLMLDNAVTLPTSIAAVESYVGLPRGARKIDIGPFDDSFFKQYSQWRAQFPTGKDVKMKDLISAFKSCGHADIFKRNFLALLNTVLIESRSNGAVNHKIIDFVRDLDNVKDYDWCSYLFEKILEHKKLWDQDRTKVFRGPVLFLLLTYVDRVVYHQKESKREYPIINGWDTKSLKERQRWEMLEGGGFGRGILRDPPSFVSKELDGDKYLFEKGQGSSAAEKMNDDTEMCLEDFIRKMATEGIKTVECVQKYLQSVQNAPAKWATNETLMKIIESHESILNIKKVTKSPKCFSDDSQDKFWNDPVVVKFCEEAEKTKSMEELYRGPFTFNLGVNTDPDTHGKMRAAAQLKKAKEILQRREAERELKKKKAEIMKKKKAEELELKRKAHEKMLKEKQFQEAQRQLKKRAVEEEKKQKGAEECLDKEVAQQGLDKKEGAEVLEKKEAENRLNEEVAEQDLEIKEAAEGLKGKEAEECLNEQEAQQDLERNEVAEVLKRRQLEEEKQELEKKEVAEELKRRQIEEQKKEKEAEEVLKQEAARQKLVEMEDEVELKKKQVEADKKEKEDEELLKEEAASTELVKMQAAVHLERKQVQGKKKKKVYGRILDKMEAEEAFKMKQLEEGKKKMESDKILKEQEALMELKKKQLEQDKNAKGDDEISMISSVLADLKKEAAQEKMQGIKDAETGMEEQVQGDMTLFSGKQKDKPIATASAKVQVFQRRQTRSQTRISKV